MRRVWGLAAIGIGLLSATHAMADPRLDEKVYDPYILNRVWEIEARHSQELGAGALDGQRSLVLEAEHGLNDRFSLAVVGMIGRDPGAGTKVNAIGVEGVAYLGQLPGIGVDTGAYVELAHGFGAEPDFVEAKLLFAKRVDRFEGLLNLIVERPLNAPAGQNYASYGYATSVTWRTVGRLRLGAQAFGDFGDDHGFLNKPQGAYVGPYMKWGVRPMSAPFDVEIEAGWLKSVGTDRAEAGSQVRFAIDLERRF